MPDVRVTTEFGSLHLTIKIFALPLGPAINFPVIAKFKGVLGARVVAIAVSFVIVAKSVTGSAIFNEVT